MNCKKPVRAKKWYQHQKISTCALGLPAEDYFNDQALEGRDLMYAGVMTLPADFWPKHGKDMESLADSKSGTMFYRVTGPTVMNMLVNQFVYQENPDGSTPFYAQVKEINGKTALLQTLMNFSHQKNNVWGVTARNREQNFAMNLLMNPDVDFVIATRSSRYRQNFIGIGGRFRASAG